MMKLNLPYSDELRPNGAYPVLGAVAGGMGTGGSERFPRPILPRENLRRMLTGESPLWIPLSTDFLTFNPGIFADVRARAMVADAGMAEIRGGPDFFGVEWEYIPAAGGSMVRPGAPKVPDITQWENVILFPDPDAMDWEGCAARNRHVLDGDRAINITLFNGYFERLISFMGFEAAALALIDEEESEAVGRLFTRLTDFYIDLLTRMRHWFRCDLVTVHDDWGSQRAPFFSPATCREIVLPHMKRLSEAAHALGMLFEQHSCGKIESHVPIMIEAGVDYWRGQPMNDIAGLTQQYGDRMAFGWRIPEMPEGAPEEEIYAAAKRFVEETAGKRVVAALYGAVGSRQVSLMRDCIYALSREYYASLI